MTNTTTDVRVAAMRLETSDILSIELQAPGGARLPEATPGAHIDVHLPHGVSRPYSIVSAQPGGYLLGVKCAADSRGGSAYIRDRLRVGDRLRIGAPRNLFPLAPEADASLLLAGGIGITPILPMARALAARGEAWHLHYFVRSEDDIAFRPQLDALGEHVSLHVGSDRSRRPCIAELVASAGPSTHLYCCGPDRMLDDYQRATAALDPARVHQEAFGAALRATAQDAEGPLEVHLARTGLSLQVPATQTVLDAILEAGVAVDHSCQIGICGACEARVLEGTPEHLDDVLTQEERAANDRMMLCCSRGKGRLVLDL